MTFIVLHMNVLHQLIYQQALNDIKYSANYKLLIRGTTCTFNRNGDTFTEGINLAITFTSTIITLK